VVKVVPHKRSKTSAGRGLPDGGGWVARSVAVKVTGHKVERCTGATPSFAERDIAEGLAKVAAFPAGCDKERDRRGTVRVPRLTPRRRSLVMWWPGTESNRRHADFQGSTAAQTNGPKRTQRDSS